MGGLADFYVTHTFWVWIAVAAAILAFEVAAGSGWLLWPSASAAVMAFVSLFNGVGGSAVIKNHLDALLLFESPEAELRDVDTKAALAAIREQ